MSENEDRAVRRDDGDGRERRPAGERKPRENRERDAGSGARRDRSDRSDRSGRRERSDRSERGERRERSERSDRSERGERWGRRERDERGERWDRGERRAGDRQPSGDRGDRGARSGERRERRDDDRRPGSRGGAGRGERTGDSARSFGPRLVPTKGRLPEPAIEEGVTGKELDRDVWTQLRTLSKENAEGVAQHLVMVAIRLAEDDVDGALAHAETAVRRAGRVPAAREALGMVAYRQGDFARALAEFRTVRRLSGSAHLLPLMVDSERGLGRHERALELAAGPEAAQLSASEQAELAIVTAGVRLDLGQLEAAVLGLERLVFGPVRPWSARAYYAYADALLARGDEAQARKWFAMAATADTDLETDAAERLDDLDGVIIIDSGWSDDDGDDAQGHSSRDAGSRPAED